MLNNKIFSRFKFIASLAHMLAALAMHASYAAGSTLLDEIKSGARNFSGRDLKGAILSGADLNSLNFRGATLDGADLSGANLRGAEFQGASLKGANLSGANLDVAIFRKAVLIGANLSRASAHSTIFAEADMRGITAEGAVLVCTLDAADLSGANLRGAKMGADMKNQPMGLMRARMAKTKLRGAHLENADLSRAFMEFADLSGANLRNVSFFGAEAAGVNFSEADMTGVDFSGADVRGARFNDVKGRSAIKGLDGGKTPGGAQAGPEPLPVTEVAPGMFVFQGAHEMFTPRNQGAIANIGFIIGGEAVAVIDTGGSTVQGERLKAAIRARTQLPIKYVINTHMHPDHVFGNPAFEGAETQFIGHAKLARALAAREQTYIMANTPLLGEASAGLRIVAPSIGVADETRFDLGGRTIRVRAFPTAHTDNDVAVFDEATGTLFAGDLLFSGHLPAIDGSLAGWLKVMDMLAGFNSQRVVPGHGPASMPLDAALAPQRRYLTRLAEDIRTAIKAGRTLGETAKIAGLSEKDAWLLFDEFNARNAAAAFAELEWEQ
jgi:quinoprotein relay system zinc metallohydrolase 2